jgi:hypothetical protein
MRHARAIAVLAAVVALAVASFTEASTATSAHASAAAKRFISKRYAYGLVLPDAYRARFAQRPWPGNFPIMDRGEVDVFTRSGDRSFVVAATPLASGTSLRDWEKSHAEVMSSYPLCQKARAFRNTTLGGITAREFQVRCPFHDAIVIVALHRGRGYTFQYVAPKENPAASDRQSLEAGRRGFRFINA